MRHVYSILLLVSVYLFSFNHVQGKQVAVPEIKAENAKLQCSKKQVKIPRILVYNTKSQSAIKKTIFDDLPLLNQVVKKVSAACYPVLKKLARFKHPVSIIQKHYTSFSFPSYVYIFNVLYPKHVFW